MVLYLFFWLQLSVQKRECKNVMSAIATRAKNAQTACEWEAQLIIADTIVVAHKYALLWRS